MASKPTSTDNARVEASFDDHARAIAKRQYMQPGDESVEGILDRVARWVAGPEVASSRDAYAERFYELMASKRFCPGGRVLAGAHTSHGNVLNCFVQDGSPREAGSTEWVLQLATKLALVTKVGGGNGLNLDPIQPKRAFAGPAGHLYLTIAPEHADYDKVRTGTYLDLVQDTYVQRGYRNATFVEGQAAPSGLQVVRVGDSVESIWGSAATMVRTLLAGGDVLLDLSDLRAEGTPVKGSGGTSSGPSSFAVEVFDNFATWAGLGGAEHAGPVATLRYVCAPTLRVIRQGGCLHPDTLVNTSRGTLRLHEIVDGHQYGWQDHHLKVATDQGWKTSPRGFNNGVSDTLRVMLANGRSLRGTRNHKLKVLRPTGEREWVAFEDLKPGDNVIQVLDQHTGAPVILRPVDLPHHDAESIDMPEVLTERLAFFLGYLWGDGFVSGGRVGFAVADGSPMMEEAPKLFQELFGLQVAVERKENDAGVVFVTKSSELVAWLGANGLMKAHARHLSIPKAVRMAPRPVVGGFLRGLFEADGSISHGMPVLATASGGLAEDVATMLAGLGIPSRSRTNVARADRFSRHATHTVRVVSNMGLERFLERVGHMEGSRLAAAREHAPDEEQERAWVLAHASAAPSEALASMPAGAKGRPSPFTPTRKTVSGYLRGERSLTATAYERLHQDPHLEHRVAGFGYDEYYVAVRSVEEAGRSLTLDLSVDENKTYLAGGFVSHNTRRGAGMATLTITHPDVRDFITAKDLDREQAEGDISTFNISVLVDDAFMQQNAGKVGQGILHDIARHAWQTGEPGLIFIDRINEFNPMRAELGDIKSTNPCVTAETWVQTQAGPRQVHELVGERFCAVVDGKAFGVTSRGFWSTGVKPVFRVRTRRGFELRLTGNHRLRKVTRLDRHALDGDWTELRELHVGDRIFLQDQRAASWSGPGDEIEGWLLGTLVGDGSFITDTAEPMAALDFRGDHHSDWAAFTEDAIRRSGHGGKVWVTHGDGSSRVASDALATLAARFGIHHGAKYATDDVERGSSAFYRGFLQGLFDADGSVQGSRTEGASVRLAQSNLDLLKRVQRMLARLGVMSAVYPERRPEGDRSLLDGTGEVASNRGRGDHELVVSGGNLAEFAIKIDFRNAAKHRELEDVLGDHRGRLDRERFYDEVVDIVPDGEEEVFDVTVEHVHAFDANGIAAHNCGEIPLYPGEPCDLGAMNLDAYVSQPGIGIDGFDRERFREDVGLCVRFLDNVLEVNRFALEDNRDMSMKLRRLGLGVMGLADALIRMGYAYDSEAGRGAVDVMISELRDAATDASTALATERGAFPLFEASELETPRRNVAVLTVAPTGTTSMLMGVSSGVEPVFAPFIYRKIGADYAALIHPLFKELLEQHAPHPAYQKDGTWDWERVTDAVQQNHGSVQGLDFIPDAVRAVLICAHDIEPDDHVRMQGVVQRAFDGGKGGSNKVANSISKTINLPNHATVQDVFSAYSLAFETGCKGITVYRDGSRQFQVLSTSTRKDDTSGADASTTDEARAVAADAELDAAPGTAAGSVGSAVAGAMYGAAAGAAATTESGPAAGIAATGPTDTAVAEGKGAADGTRGGPAAARPNASRVPTAPQAPERLPGEPLFDRPLRLSGFTDQVKLMLPSGERRGFYVTVNKQLELPTEVFIASGKAGDEANADSEALGRVVSIALQYGVPAEAIVKTLRGINGGMYGTYHGRVVASKADLIAVALETAGAENVLNRGRACPECGAPLRFEEGCQKCESCGYSKCG